MRILITGGAGFVGSHLAASFKLESGNCEVVALDNLKRRGSELNLSKLKKLGITFCHGDIRNISDLEDLPGSFDAVIEASAEPSVLSGLHGSPSYAIDTNLKGTLNCLEFVRRRSKALIFLSTSRVYSIQSLKDIPLEETESRFVLTKGKLPAGVTGRGVSERFPTNSARSIYGATKLASEIMIQEYEYAYGLPAIINRCGVICGPGQFGKPDQGVFVLWMLHHYFGWPLTYTGFGGSGKQVRDLLHPDDLYSLIKLQLNDIHNHSGQIFNVGGGNSGAISLRELTTLCEQVFGRRVVLSQVRTTHPMDIPYYVSDCEYVAEQFQWKAKAQPLEIVQSVRDWISQNENQLRELFLPANSQPPAAPRTVQEAA